METDDGFFNATMGAYWLTEGNNRISGREISWATLDCKGCSPIEIIQGTLVFAYASEAGEKLICKMSLRLAVIFRNRQGVKLQILHSGSIRLCVDAEKVRLCVCICVLGDGGWWGLKIVPRAPDENKGCKQERTCGSTFLSLSAIWQKGRQQNCDVVRHVAKICITDAKFWTDYFFCSKWKRRYCTLPLGENQTSAGNSFHLEWTNNSPPPSCTSCSWCLFFCVNKIFLHGRDLCVFFSYVLLMLSYCIYCKCSLDNKCSSFILS